jgi:transposase
MGRAKYEVRLSEEERRKIQAVGNGKDTSVTRRKRANILLLADRNAGKPMSQAEISVRCGVSNVTVFNVLRGYCAKGYEEVLTYKRTTPNNPPIVTGDVEARIVALACGEAPEGRARWTLQLLTEKIIELKILEAVSDETVRTTLKKRNLSLI